MKTMTGIENGRIQTYAITREGNGITEAFRIRTQGKYWLVTNKNGTLYTGYNYTAAATAFDNAILKSES
jgi:hypothetical protein